jgi:hypothetical protein
MSVFFDKIASSLPREFHNGSRMSLSHEFLSSDDCSTRHSWDIVSITRSSVVEEPKRIAAL